MSFIIISIGLVIYSRQASPTQNAIHVGGVVELSREGYSKVSVHYEASQAKDGEGYGTFQSMDTGNEDDG